MTYEQCLSTLLLMGWKIRDLIPNSYYADTIYVSLNRKLINIPEELPVFATMYLIPSYTGIQYKDPKRMSYQTIINVIKLWEKFPGLLYEEIDKHLDEKYKEQV